MNRYRRGNSLCACLAAATLLAAAGCETLPGGTPPPGNITDNTPPPDDTPVARHNRLVTQLIAFALQNEVRSLDPGKDPELQKVARDAAAVAGFGIAAGAPLKLVRERADDGSMELAVTDAKQRVVWRSDHR